MSAALTLLLYPATGGLAEDGPGRVPRALFLPMAVLDDDADVTHWDTFGDADPMGRRDISGRNPRYRGNIGNRC